MPLTRQILHIVSKITNSDLIQIVNYSAGEYNEGVDIEADRRGEEDDENVKTLIGNKEIKITFKTRDFKNSKIDESSPKAPIKQIENRI